MKIKSFLTSKGPIYQYHCPGCGEDHALDATWVFNNDYDKPTFRPSVLVRTRVMPLDLQDGIKPFVCHSFIVNGEAQFLSDCTHEHAGKTLEIKEF